MTLTTAVPAAPTSPVDLVHKPDKPKVAMPSVAAICAHGEWALEPKYDGWRMLAYVAEDGVHIYTHTGNDKTGWLPKIESEFASLPAGTWIDGEAVAFSIEAPVAPGESFVVHEWNGVQKCLGSNKDKGRLLEGGITFVAFDLIAHANIDARSLPYSKRRELLEAIFEKREWERVMLTPQLPATDEQVEKLIEQGFEGGVVKSLGSRYQSGGRGLGQFKIKPQDTDDFVVMGYKPGENSFSGMVGAIIFGSFDGDTLVERGRCSGMDMATRQSVSNHPEKYLGKVIEVAHMGFMNDGYRHPQWKRFRPDKDPSECRV